MGESYDDYKYCMERNAECKQVVSYCDAWSANFSVDSGVYQPILELINNSQNGLEGLTFVAESDKVSCCEKLMELKNNLYTTLTELQNEIAIIREKAYEDQVDWASKAIKIQAEASMADQAAITAYEVFIK